MIRLLLAGLMAVKLATPGDLNDEIQIDEFTEFDETSNSSLSKLLETLSLKLGLSDKEEDIDADIAEDRPLLLNRSSGDPVKYKNVVIYTGTFNNTDVRLVVPYSSYSNLCIFDDCLCNVGSSVVTGRFLYNDDEVDINDYETYNYILNPIYNSPANVYRYGSYNYQRHYYLQNSQIYSQDLYGKFYVDDVKIYYSSAERIYYEILVLIVLLGVRFIWTRQ